MEHRHHCPLHLGSMSAPCHWPHCLTKQPLAAPSMRPLPVHCPSPPRPLGPGGQPSPATSVSLPCTGIPPPPAPGARWGSTAAGLHCHRLWREAAVAVDTHRGGGRAGTWAPPVGSTDSRHLQVSITHGRSQQWALREKSGCTEQMTKLGVKPVE